MISFTRFLLTAAVISLSACGGDPEPTPKESETSQAEVQPTSVKTAQVKRETIQTWIFGEGTARAVNREFLSFESAGRIAYLDPELKEGDPVNKGQVIAYQRQDRTDADTAGASANLIDAQTQRRISEASVSEAKANLSLAQRTFERYATLLEQRSASQQEYDEAKAKLEQAQAALAKAERQFEASAATIDSARANLDKTKVAASESRLVAPISGVIGRLNIDQGFYFSPQQIQSNTEGAALNTVPVVIIDPSQFEVRVSVPSFQYRGLQPKARVIIEPNLPNSAAMPINSGRARNPGPVMGPSSVEAQIFAISPSVDPETRTFSVKVRTPENSPNLQDGEFVTTWMAGPSAEQALTVPFEAVRYDNNDVFVFVYDPQRRTVSRRQVETGLQSQSAIQITSGLSEGDSVVTEGRSKIADGDSVRVLASTPAQGR